MKNDNYNNIFENMSRVVLKASDSADNQQKTKEVEMWR